MKDRPLVQVNSDRCGEKVRLSKIFWQGRSLRTGPLLGGGVTSRHDHRPIGRRRILAPMEGESELRFCLASEPCTLTFSVVHGRHLALPCATAIFIGGLQGGLDCRQDIRTAAKLNDEVSPAAVLLLAAEALANVLGVDHIVGVSSAEQAAAGYAEAKIALSYDRLWQEFGAHGKRSVARSKSGRCCS